VQGLHEVGVLAELLQRCRAHAGLSRIEIAT
jgi:hypothetical protein